MLTNMPTCLALFGATDDDGSNRRNMIVVGYTTTERRKVNYKLLRYLDYLKQSREYTHSKGHKARKKRERQSRRMARSKWESHLQQVQYTCSRTHPKVCGVTTSYAPSAGKCSQTTRQNF